MASKGFNSISTTLDPDWLGPLLIATRNNTNTILTLKKGQPFVTLMFYRTESKATKHHGKPSKRTDILSKLLIRKDTTADLTQSENNLIEKISPMLSEVASITFSDAVKEANRGLFSKKYGAAKQTIVINRSSYIKNAICFVFIVGILALPLYFKWLANLFLFNIQYDTNIFVGQIVASVPFLIYLLTSKK